VTPLVLAVLLPVLTVGALTFVSTGEADEAAVNAPARTALTRTSLGCPVARGAARTVEVASSLAERRGQVTIDVLGKDGEPRALDLRPRRLSSVRLDGAAVMTGEDEWAAGLLAARVGDGATIGCEAPATEAWFTGLGARPQHSSLVELVNPGPGPAIADLRILSPGGPLDVPDVRGVRVPGRSSVVLDLARIIPRRTELAVQVVVSRGRLVSSVWDTVDALDGGPATSDWMAAQPAPATSGLLLGLPEGAGSRRLTIANGGEDETRVELRIVAPESVFDPAGMAEIRVPPGSVRSVLIDDVLAREIRAGATGLLVESTNPVTTTLRSFVADDIAHTVAVPPVTERAAALVPRGTGRLLLAGASLPGVAKVLTRDAGGRELREERVEIGPDRSVSVRLPNETAYVRVAVGRTSTVASALVRTAAGAVVVPLRETVSSGLVPAVLPEPP